MNAQVVHVFGNDCEDSEEAGLGEKALMKKFETLRSRGIAHGENAEWREALDALIHAHQALPRRFAKSVEEAKVLEMVAQIHLEMGEFFKAISYAERAKMACPAFVPAIVTLGRAQRNFGELEMARDSLQQGQKMLESPECIYQMDIDCVDQDLAEVEQMLTLQKQQEQLEQENKLEMK